MRDVRIVLPDVSSPAAMAEAEASELKDTLKVAAHSKLKAPRRRMEEHAGQQRI